MMRDVLECAHIPFELPLDADTRKAAWRAVEPAWLSLATEATPADAIPPDERAWFCDDAPKPPASGPLPTALRVLWSDSSLYLLFQCADSDVWSTRTRRDDPLYEEEVVEAFLCPTGDARRYYELELSPRNVLFDARVDSPERNRLTMRVDTAWSCAGIRTAVRVCGVLEGSPPERRSGTPALHRSRWWTAELAVPFAAFPEAPRPRPGDAWRANFFRIDGQVPPVCLAWRPTLEVPANFHVPDRFGALRFV